MYSIAWLCGAVVWSQKDKLSKFQAVLEFVTILPNRPLKETVQHEKGESVFTAPGMPEKPTKNDLDFFMLSS
jgi:hypothetical protein